MAAKSKGQKHAPPYGIPRIRATRWPGPPDRVPAVSASAAIGFGRGPGATHDRTKILGWETVCPGASLTGPAGQIFPSLQVMNAGAQGTPNSPRHGTLLLLMGKLSFMRCPCSVRSEQAGLAANLSRFAERHSRARHLP